MSYSYQSSNGQVVETKGDKVYLNGREINTGKLKPSVKIIILMSCLASFAAGYLFAIV